MLLSGQYAVCAVCGVKVVCFVQSRPNDFVRGRLYVALYILVSRQLEPIFLGSRTPPEEIGPRSGQRMGMAFW